MLRLIGTIGFVFIWGHLSASANAASHCSAGKRVVDACYQVHGRLRFYANMRLYLWPVGTKRLLAIAFESDEPDADYYYPANVAGYIDPDTDVFGDFQVCPFTPEEPGKMQTVCIDSASNLAVRKRN